uniref:N-acetyltransferase domain-containing protein n=1 Tax=Bicosoecida sp. CB-2014 TaxID=1486930 RepID=A0A7S1GCT5_9STRA
MAAAESTTGGSGPAPAHPSGAQGRNERGSRIAPLLRTARLVLRPTTLDDVHVVHEWLAREDHTAGSWYGPNMPEDTHAFFDGAVNAQLAEGAEGEAATEHLWSAWLEGEGGDGRPPELVACVAVSMGDARSDTAEIGYQVAPSHWRRGYGLELARALRDHAFDALGVRRIEAVLLACNEGSRRVAEGLGMRLEATRREKWVKKDGSVHGELLFAMLSSEREVAAAKDGGKHGETAVTASGSAAQGAKPGAEDGVGSKATASTTTASADAAVATAARPFPVAPHRGRITPSISTPRLELRPLRPSDVDVIAEWCEVEDASAAVSRAFASPAEAHAALDAVVAAQSVAGAAGDKPSAHAWGAWLTGIAAGAGDDGAGAAGSPEPTLVGLATLSFGDPFSADTAELVFQVGPSFGRRGFGLEIARAARDHAFATLRLRRVHASMLADNVGAKRIVESIGMQLEGTSRQALVSKDGSVHDAIEYGMLEREYAVAITEEGAGAAAAAAAAAASARSVTA